MHTYIALSAYILCPTNTSVERQPPDPHRLFPFPSSHSYQIRKMLCQECKVVLKQPMTLKKESSRLEFRVATFQYNVSLSDFEAKATSCYCCRGMLRRVNERSDLELQGDSILQIHYTHGLRVNHTRSVPCWFRASAKFDGLSLGGSQAMHFEEAKDEGL